MFIEPMIHWWKLLCLQCCTVLQSGCLCWLSLAQRTVMMRSRGIGQTVDIKLMTPFMSVSRGWSAQRVDSANATGLLLGAVYTAKVFTSNKTLSSFHMTTTCWQPWNHKHSKLDPECNLLKPQPSVWTGKWSACEHGDNANANASGSQCILIEPLQNSDEALCSAQKAGWLWRQAIKANLSVGMQILEVNLRLKFFLAA